MEVDCGSAQHGTIRRYRKFEGSCPNIIKKIPGRGDFKNFFCRVFLFAQDIRTSSHMRETALHFQGEYDTI